MASRPATGLLLAMAVASGPALACKGPSVIFADNFINTDPAWYGQLDVAGGHASLPAGPKEHGLAFYGGKKIDSGDACIDMLGPTTTSAGGLVFGFTDVDNYYLFLLIDNNAAGIFLHQNGAWLTPAQPRTAIGARNGANAMNALRVTWKGTAVATYINDQPFITLNIPQPFQNSFVGLYAEDQASSGPGVNFQFSNLKVTNVP
jgi:hypothetical protein